MILFALTIAELLGFAVQDKDSTITIEELKMRMNEDSSIVILDVRTQAELRGSLGMIDGVINIPIDELKKRIHELNKFKNKEIAVICRSGNRSNKGMQILRAQGFNAKNVLGGMIEYNRKKN